jgi:hypothetical protein
MIDAALNNAEWCDAVCRSHGLPTRFAGDVWVCLRRSPMFYPDAVTLAPAVAPADVLRDIDTSAGCSVKDSFATLDLAPHGFEVLFEAEWIRLGPIEGAAVWAPTPHLGHTLFRGAEGSVIANVTGAVVGLSNLVATGDVDAAWDCAVRSVAAHFPGRPMVGYERDDDLAAAHRAGFTSTGPLRVWMKP